MNLTGVPYMLVDSYVMFIAL